MTQDEFNILIKPIFNSAFCIGYLDKNESIANKLAQFDDDNTKAKVLLCAMYSRSKE